MHAGGSSHLAGHHVCMHISLILPVWPVRTTQQVGVSSTVGMMHARTYERACTRTYRQRARFFFTRSVLVDEAGRQALEYVYGAETGSTHAYVGTYESVPARTATPNTGVAIFEKEVNNPVESSKLHACATQQL
jgi:hypothetical protein